MQFTGHSLPVHQSMSVPWEFFYLVPFRQPISAHAISSHNCHQNVSPPSGALPWKGIFGRVECQNTTHGYPCSHGVESKGGKCHSSEKVEIKLSSSTEESEKDVAFDVE